MDNPIARNVPYLSPQIQYEIIGIIAYDVLQRDLSNEVKKAKFFTILAEEVEGHYLEQLPICVKFVENRMIYARSSWSLEDALRLMARQYPMRFFQLYRKLILIL